ncbi:MAG TPA: DUF6067 family protein [Candidatus Hydrogenedentes bacterium]|nr:DUF6067 family protein [Candidatus Hydrogenedentota bacterium]
MRKLLFPLAFSLICCCSIGAESTANKDCILFAKDYGKKLIQSKNGVRLWWTSSGWKISQDRPVPRGHDHAITVSLAKNESEAVQLVVNPKRGLNNFTAQPGDLYDPDGNKIDAPWITVLRVRYVFIDSPTDRSSVRAWWPDPLPPFKAPINIESKKNQPLWVRVQTPKNARPGVYTGSIKLQADGYCAEVPIQITIYDFTLPDRTTCITALGFDSGAVFQYQKISDPDQRHAVIDKYLQNMREHRITPYDPAPFSNVSVTWRTLSTNEGAQFPDEDRKLFQTYPITPVFDWTAWDAEMERSFEKFHFNSFRLGIPGIGGGNFFGKSAPAEVQGLKTSDRAWQLAFDTMCKGYQEHLREKGWLDESYIYWFDEPTPKDYPHVLEGFLRVKNAAPDIPRMITEKPVAGLFDGPNVWCPVSWKLNPKETEARRKLGETIWWYVCTIPKAPFATEFTDHAAVELRTWLWQTWKYNIEGILVWRMNLWTTGCAYPDRLQDPYEDPMAWMSGYGTKPGEKRPWGNGDGRFMYPPEGATGYQDNTILDGPVDSIRWEMLRDGIEDYEYLVILREALQKHESSLSEQEQKDFSALLTVPEEITTDLKHFSKDPAPIEKQRDTIARAIERLLTKSPR